jgi:hypothetical protein
MTVQAEEPRRAAFPAAPQVIRVWGDMAVREDDHKLALDGIAEVAGTLALCLAGRGEHQHPRISFGGG